MSETRIQKGHAISSSANKQLEPQLDSISETLITEDDDDVELLKYTGSRNLYLTKVGLVFCFYWLICVGVLTVVMFTDEGFRQKYFKYRVFQKTWTYLYIIIGLKVFMSFLGAFVRGLSTLFFLIDCYLVSTFSVSLYFYLEGYKQDQYNGNGYWVVAGSYALFFGSIGFVLSAMIKDNKRVFNFLLGILFMSLFSAIGLFAAIQTFTTPQFHKTEYTIVFGAVVAYSVFFAINSYQVITFRVEKFYDDEFSYCFFCYFTDWFTFFLIDLFRNASFHRLKQRADALARDNLKNKKRIEGIHKNHPLKVSELHATKVDIEAQGKNDSF